MHPTSLPSVSPFNQYLGTDFWKQMNVYVAISSPAEDPSGAQALVFCANIDAEVNLVTNGIGYGSRPYGGSPGGFSGQVPRPAITAPQWAMWPDRLPGSGSNYFVLVHEVFGHGVGALTDEYLSRNRGTDPRPVHSQGYRANSVPLTCEGLCQSAQSVTELQAMMTGDVDAVCWNLTTEATCANPGGNAVCHWIGNLPPISYWGAHTCIPHNVSQYNIGQQCEANTGCFPLAYAGTSGSYLGVARPGSAIMQSSHMFPGFSGAVENYLSDMMECVFTKTCDQYPTSKCTTFQNKWGTPDNGWFSAFEQANACEDTIEGTIYRRR
jgi:hypothetical protein